MALRIVLLHEQLKINKDGVVETIYNDRASAEAAMMYVSVALYFISFLLYIWSAFMQQDSSRKHSYLMEKYFGVDFSDISGVSFDEVEDFEEEKKRGYTIKKAKDVIHRPVVEIHEKHITADL